MLTVKVVEPDQKETVFEISTAEYFPRDTKLHKAGVVLSMPDGSSAHYGESPVNRDDPIFHPTTFYVMNRNGATVATYSV